MSRFRTRFEHGFQRFASSRMAIACGSQSDLPGDETARYRVAAGAGGAHIVSSNFSNISRMAIACGSHSDLPGDETARYRVAAGAGGPHIMSYNFSNISRLAIARGSHSDPSGR